MKFLGFITALILLSSCGSELKREDLLPDAFGPYGQVIVLMEDDLWNGPVGEAVMYHLDQNAKGVYLRPEPMFDIVRMKPDELDHVGQMNRLILKVMVDFDSTYKETAIIEKKDYFAKGQLFLIVKDSDVDRLYSFVVNEFAMIVNMMNDFTIQELITQYKTNFNPALKSKAEKDFGITLSVPEDFKTKIDSSNFIWAKRDRSKHVMPNETSEPGADTYWIQQGLLIWSVPYTDTSQLTESGVLQNRDTVLKYHVPGKLKGSYMATEYDPYYKPKSKIIKVGEAYTVQVHGLWKHAGNPAAFGGGPFVMYAIHNEKRNTVVSVCIYIYGPKYDKREYIREAEAMLKTIELVD